MRIFASILITIGLTGTAAAQDTEHRSDDAAPDTIFVFGDDFVTGGTDGPDGALIHVRPPGRRVSLIRPRLHFVPELLKSVERM